MAAHRVPSSPGERLCAAYLRQRGWLWEYERPLGRKRPDFTVTHTTGTFVVEVYEPKEEVDWSGSNARDPAALPSKLFRSKTKRQQIAEAHKHGLPCLVVLVATNSIIISAIDIAIAMMGLKGYTGPTSFNDVSGIAVLEAFNPTAWLIGPAADTRLGSRKRAAPLEAKVNAMLIATEDLSASGAFDESASAARLSVLINPFADLPLNATLFPGPHDEVWGRTGKAGPEWFGKVAEGSLFHELGDSI